MKGYRFVVNNALPNFLSVFGGNFRVIAVGLQWGVGEAVWALFVVWRRFAARIEIRYGTSNHLLPRRKRRHDAATTGERSDDSY